MLRIKNANTIAANRTNLMRKVAQPHRGSATQQNGETNQSSVVQSTRTQNLRAPKTR